MSALNNTAPRFRAQIPGANGTSSAAAAAAAAAVASAASAHSYAPRTVDVPPRLASALAATPLAPPPPPPLHMSSTQPSRSGVRYAGVDHTLGPTFSEEEDGDDSDFIAAKMASLGLGYNNFEHHQQQQQQRHHQQQQQQQQQYDYAAKGDRMQNADLQSLQQHMYRNNQQAAQRRQQQQQAQQQQQQHQQAQQQQQHILQLQQQQQLQQQYHKHQQQQAAALQNLLLTSNDPQQLREAMALLELQRAQLAATTPAGHLERAYAAQQQQSQQAAAAAAMNQQRRAQQNVKQAMLAQQHHPHHPHHAAHHQRGGLAAQLEAGTLRREREREASRTRPLSPDDAQLRAMFESVPTGYFPPISPPVDSAAGVGWTSTTRAPEWSQWTAPTRAANTNNNKNPTNSSSRASSPPAPPVSAGIGRFTTRTRQDLAAARSSAPSTTPLAALLARRRPTDDDTASVLSLSEMVATSPNSENGPTASRVEPERKWSSESAGRQVESDSGHILHKDPSSYFEWGHRMTAPRSQSFSLGRSSDNARPADASAAPYTQPVITRAPVSIVTRQPYGPPHSAAELKHKNFASSMRRKAGINLGMLNRRTESVDVLEIAA